MRSASPHSSARAEPNGSIYAQNERLPSMPFGLLVVMALSGRGRVELILECYSLGEGCIRLVQLSRAQFLSFEGWALYALGQSC